MINLEKNTTEQHFRIKTDFEKLLFTTAYIEELKLQIENLKLEKGYLQSEIEELKYKFISDNPELARLESYKSMLKSIHKKRMKYKLRWEMAEHEIILLKMKLNELEKSKL